MTQESPDRLSESPPEESENGDAAVETSGQAPTNEGTAPPLAQSSEAPRKRKDVDHLHATRHAVLSRYPLETLRNLGEDVKRFRRLERRLRAALKPRGEIAAILFDRFFSSYLRCLLAARLEASAFEPKAAAAKQPSALPTLREREFPTLLLPEEKDDCMVRTNFPPDIFHEPKEMYRALSVLLVLRGSSEVNLEHCIGHMLGPRKESSEG